MRLTNLRSLDGSGSSDRTVRTTTSVLRPSIRPSGSTIRPAAPAPRPSSGVKPVSTSTSTSTGTASDGVRRATPLIKTNHAKTIDPKTVGSRHPAAVFWGERLNAGEFPAHELAGKINWAEAQGYDTAKYVKLNSDRGYSADPVGSASSQGDDGSAESSNPVVDLDPKTGSDASDNFDDSSGGGSPGVGGDCFGCRVKNFITSNKLVVALLVTLLIFLVFRKVFKKKGGSR